MFSISKDKDIKRFLKNILTDPINKINGVNCIKDIKGKMIIDNREIICDIFLIVNYGTVISDVSWHVQNVTKEILSSIEDIKIKSINIHVIGVNKENFDD